MQYLRTWWCPGPPLQAPGPPEFAPGGEADRRRANPLWGQDCGLRQEGGGRWAGWQSVSERSPSPGFSVGRALVAGYAEGAGLEGLEDWAVLVRDWKEQQ